MGPLHTAEQMPKAQAKVAIKCASERANFLPPTDWKPMCDSLLFKMLQIKEFGGRLAKKLTLKTKLSRTLTELRQLLFTLYQYLCQLIN